MYYTCIACITLDSVLKIGKKNYPQVYLEECKHRVEKICAPNINIINIINIELESGLESDVDKDLDSNTTIED